MIAGTHSGAGKTTATGVVLRGLIDRGLRVQSFKLGPDFIDPGYHREITGRPSINLDLWLMGSDGVRDSFRRWSAGADICVIESMGALFDGTDGTGHGSAAHVAKLLGVPVVVIIDVWGMTRTAAAILSGLRDFDSELRWAGCVVNRSGSPGHTRMIMNGLPTDLQQTVIGAIERDPGLAVPERHLGLLTVDENEATIGVRSDHQRRAAAGLDLDRLLARAAADPGDAVITTPHKPSAEHPARARLAVARDRAFCFYYEENLQMLRRTGFELVEFRPTVDHELPADVDAVYLGGGYPESFAAELAGNRSLLSELRRRAADGMPIWAECGGMMYLARSLTGFDGVRHRLAGVLPIDVIMDRDYLSIRYAELRTRSDSPLGPSSSRLWAQEFHQSRIIADDLEPNLFDGVTSSGEKFAAGYQVGKVVASYLHLHLSRTPQVADSLMAAALARR
ncbi:cobyrinate a,c-diamide synthase [Microlunatus elymi]|uniref:Hydrogenobyrinate a,c-diamide synthase n=2 Tax=Microlunatus elymi TaxID=2596828 RepID=A0A516Q5I8_9ACTN|nr:cobyrinate a,c-diamide synthase [Microlunatus elymi]